MLSVNYLNSFQNFSDDLKKNINRSWDDFDFVANILNRPVGSIVEINGKQHVVQPWTQQVLDDKLEDCGVVNDLGMVCVFATLISLIAAPIIASLGVVFGLALGAACGYAAIPLGVSLIAFVIVALIAGKIERSFQLQTIYHLQNAWANPASFDIRSVRTFRPNFSFGTRAEQYANLVTSIQLLRNRQPENAEIYAKMLLGHQINTLQPVNPRSATLLKFFKTKAILNRISFIQAHRTVNLNGTTLDIDAAIAAGN